MKVGVVGAGTMGSGIAQVCAFHSHQVYLKDVTREQLSRGFEGIRRSLRKILEKQQVVDQERRDQEILERIHLTIDWDVMVEVDFVIEAVFEDLEVKKQVFHSLDSICRPDAVLATNTSSISITRLAGVTKHPERFIGMHFMNPVPIMKLVEIIRGLATSENTFKKTKALALDLGKITVGVNDFPGFISNRVLMPMLNEAIFALMEGVADAESIDQVMKLGMNHPMGPLQLADYIGLDVCLDVMKVLHEGFGDPKYRPCPLLQRMVDAGWLGRKSGKGFYEYDPS